MGETKTGAKAAAGIPEAVIGGLGEAARAIGGDGFYPALIEAVSGCLGWHSRAVVRYSLYAVPEFLARDHLDQEMLDLYLRGYYRVDPYYQTFRERPRAGVIGLRRELAAEHGNAYVMIYAPMARWADELGLMMPAFGGTAIGLFWEQEERRFTDAEVAAVRAVYPLVAGLHEAHLARQLDAVGLSGGKAAGPCSPAAPPARAHAVVDLGGTRVIESAGWASAAPGLDAAFDALRDAGGGDAHLPDGGLLHVERLSPTFAVAPDGWLAVYEPAGEAPGPVTLERALDTFRTDSLTPREREIAGLILTGRANAAIADELGIEVGSVKNHRVRLYRKLGIQNERELFKLFLDHIVALDAD